MVGPPDEKGVDDTKGVFAAWRRRAVPVHDDHIEASGAELLVETSAEAFGHMQTHGRSGNAEVFNQHRQQLARHGREDSYMHRATKNSGCFLYDYLQSICLAK